MEIMGQAEEVHNCRDELPIAKIFKMHPDRVRPGTVTKCSCGQNYVWEYHGYSETWGWTRLENSTKWKLEYIK